MWLIYTMEHYLAIKKNWILLFAGKWRELEIMLSKVAWLKRSKVASFLSFVEARLIR
jgi:hypothetical protein